MSVIRRSMMRHPESGNWGMPETPDGNYVNYSAYKELADKAAEVLREASHVYRLYNATQMPDGNLVDEQTLQELADLLGSDTNV